MRRRKLKPPPGTGKVFLFIMLAVILLSVILLHIFIGPEKLLDNIGPRNTYLIAFIISFFAGFSAITVVSYYSVLITLISGGLDPLPLALISGASLAAGDIFLYYFGRKGRDIIYGRLDRSINRMALFFRKHRLEKFIPSVAYVYISFIPLPNDWLLLFLASIRYPHKRMNLIIALGDITHAAALVFLATKGVVLFK